jgi:hypothetical protein
VQARECTPHKGEVGQFAAVRYRYTAFLTNIRRRGAPPADCAHAACDLRQILQKPFSMFHSKNVEITQREALVLVPQKARSVNLEAAKDLGARVRTLAEVIVGAIVGAVVD